MHCAQIGRTPAEFARRIAYRFGDSVRWSEAKEFFFFRPKSDDADRLIRIAEVIIHEWVTDPATQTRLVSYKSLGKGTSKHFPGPDRLHATQHAVYLREIHLSQVGSPSELVGSQSWPSSGRSEAVRNSGPKHPT